MNIMTVYIVRVEKSALEDIQELYQFLLTVKSKEGAHQYIIAMNDEMMSLSVFANCFALSRSKTIRAIHSHARRMVSHNRKYVYVFHIEGDIVYIDRILKASMVTR